MQVYLWQDRMKVFGLGKNAMWVLLYDLSVEKVMYIVVI